MHRYAACHVEGEWLLTPAHRQPHPAPGTRLKRTRTPMKATSGPAETQEIKTKQQQGSAGKKDF